jgi:hypothetical protein
MSDILKVTFIKNVFMITKMFVIFGKVKPGIESIRGLNLAVIKHMTFQVTIPS